MFFVTAGTTFHIGTARPGWLARLVAGGDFSGEAWTEVRGLSSLGRTSGEWGGEEILTPDLLAPNDAQMATFEKTIRPAVSMQITAGIIEDDPGQIAMLAAEHSLDAFAFRMVLPNGAQRRFIALVMAADHAFDEANSVLSWAFSLRLQSNMLRD